MRSGYSRRGLSLRGGSHGPIDHRPEAWDDMTVASILAETEPHDPPLTPEDEEEGDQSEEGSDGDSFSANQESTERGEVFPELE
jgi:hypothetical protein